MTERSDIPSKSLDCPYCSVFLFLCSGTSEQYNTGTTDHDSGDHELSTCLVCLLVLPLVSKRE